MNVNISKRNLILILMIVLLFVTVYTFVFTLSMKQQMESFKNELERESPRECTAGRKEVHDAEAEVSQSYTMLEYNRKIGVYSNESGKLLEVLDVLVVTLPKADREMLKEGIYAASEKELVSLVEDYTS